MAVDDLKGTKVVSAIVPTSRLDQYPTHYAEFGKGGYRSVATIADRDNIPEQRRELGMKVYVIETKTEYTLEDSLDNSNWIVKGSSNGENGPIGELVSPDGTVFLISVTNEGRLVTTIKI